MNRKELKSGRKSKGQRKGWESLKSENPDWEQRMNVMVEVTNAIFPTKPSQKVSDKLQSQYFLIP